MRCGKSAGVDDILPEQFKYLVDNAIDWIAKFLNNCLDNLTVPKLWRQSRIVTLMKPEKDPNKWVALCINSYNNDIF
jgi:hypothetical protein